MSSRKRTEPGCGQLRLRLERIYSECNRRVYVDPDPLVFLYGYDDPGDREIVALAASSLAYGRVAQILKSVRVVLDAMGPSPRRFLMRMPEGELASFLPLSFRHRFSSGSDVSLMLVGAKRALARFGSLEECFLDGFSGNDGNVAPALAKFASFLCSAFPEGESYLLPSPEKGSACKRLNLMLRWLVRKDGVDPGGWSRIPPSKLIVPLDTHMFKIARELGLCKRKSADLKAALEITEAFAKLCPSDPVKYDFALTRFGIHPKLRGLKFSRLA